MLHVWVKLRSTAKYTQSVKEVSSVRVMVSHSVGPVYAGRSFVFFPFTAGISAKTADLRIQLQRERRVLYSCNDPVRR